MSRKNLLSSLTERKLTVVNSVPASEVSPSLATEKNRSRGAFGAITRSIDELAEKAQAAKEFESRLLEGETVVELDPDIIDPSFVADRIGEDEEIQRELVEALRHRGQDSPILVRPHPKVSGRYMVIFGHRRHRAAKTLGRKVRTVIKDLGDRDHVIAQGQENSARADLSFIEKAVFASNLEQRGFEREVIMQALSVDKTVVSKLISVTRDVPNDVIAAIGPAKHSGRDRWYHLAIKCREDGASHKARELTASTEFQKATSDEKLELLVKFFDRANQTERPRKHASTNRWAPPDRSVSVLAKSRSKGFAFDITERDAKPFGQWISKNLDSLYEAFRKSKMEN